jgi:hypothetical protein
MLSTICNVKCINLLLVNLVEAVVMKILEFEGGEVTSPSMG